MTRRTVWIVLLATGACLSGCEAWKERMSRPVDPKPSSPAELKVRAAQAQPERVTTVPTSATTPRGAYEMYRQAILDGQFDRCWPLLSANTQDACNHGAAELKMRILNDPNPAPRDVEVLYNVGLTRQEVKKLDGRRFFVGSCMVRGKDPHAFDPLTRSRFDHTLVRGDHASVYLRDAEGVLRDEPMRMVRESGEWRVELMPAGANR